MKSLAARFARAVNRALGRSGRVLADRYHLRVLRSPREVRNALAYVLLNARRHLAKRLPRGAAEPAQRPSSCPTGLGARHRVSCGGWRRHGLIGPAEVPGGRRR